MKHLKKRLLKAGQLSAYQTIINKAWAKDWVVFCEPSFADADRVIEYLGNYTYRVAISNGRIQDIDDKSVHFLYKDYRDKAKGKSTKMTGVEFLRRFCMHILPKGFVKTRYYRILSRRYKKKIVLFRVIKPDRPKESVEERLKRLTGFDVHKCPFCKKGQMHIIEILPRVRSHGRFLHPKRKE